MSRDERPRPPEGEPPAGLPWPLVVLAAALLILGAQHQMGFDYAILGHIDNLFLDFEAIDRGELWVVGPHFGESGIRLGGPMYAWLHLPARLIANPCVGLLATYAGYQALAVLLLVVAARKGGALAGAAMGAALFVASDTRLLEPFIENSTLAALWSCIGFALLLLALSRRWLGWSAAAGGALTVAFLVHHLTAIGLAAAAVGLFALRQDRRRRTLAFAAGAAVVALACSPGMRIGEGRVAGEPTVPTGIFSQLMEGLFSLELLQSIGGMLLEGWLLVPLGLVLAVVLIRRQPETRPALLAALAWAVLALGLSTAALAQRIGATEVHDSELSTGVERMMHASAPARAMLMGLALWAALGWLGGWLARRWPRLGGARLRLVVMLAITLGATGWDRLQWSPRTPFEGGPVAKLYDLYQGDEHNVRDAYEYLDHMLSLGVGRVPPDRVHSAEMLPRLLARWRPPLLRPSRTNPRNDDHVVFVPPYDRWEQLRFAGAEARGTAMLIDGCVLLEHEETQREVSFDWQDQRVIDGLLVVLRSGPTRGSLRRQPGECPGLAELVQLRWPAGSAVWTYHSWKVFGVKARLVDRKRSCTLHLPDLPEATERPKSRGMWHDTTWTEVLYCPAKGEG